MAKRYDWEKIRAEFEAGATAHALGLRKEYPTRQGIAKRAKAEGWTQDCEQAIRNKVAAKVAGVVAGSNPKKKAEAIDAEASRRAEIEQRHRDEPNQIRELLNKGLQAHKEAGELEDEKERLPAKKLAFEDLKAAKISSEALGNVHTLERKAWRLDEAGSKQSSIKIDKDDEGL